MAQGYITRRTSAGGVAPIWPYYVTNFTGVAVDTAVTLKWTDPESAEWVGTKIVRKLGGYPADPSDGALVIDSIVRDQYKTVGFVDHLDVPDGTMVYYQAFPYSAEGVSYDSANRIPPIQITYIRPAAPTDMAISAGNEELTIYFTPAADAVQTDMAWKQGTPPTSIEDGTLVTNVSSGHVLSGLTNDTQYGVSLWSKNAQGRYSATHAQATGTPTEGFEFSYTGTYEEETYSYSDGTYRQIKLLTSGTLTPGADKTVDVFLVGGGGGAQVGGGGGGYTSTQKSITLENAATYTAVVGASGSGGTLATNGGNTTFNNYTAVGGKAGLGSGSVATGRSGGAGGSGGGCSSPVSPYNGGDGGSDGGNGVSLNGTSGGIGQGTTTRAFGDSLGELYGGGGGGWAYNSTAGAGGAGGGGNGSNNNSSRGSSGTVNTGGGGGGGNANGNALGGDGGSGIIILRWEI